MYNKKKQKCKEDMEAHYYWWEPAASFSLSLNPPNNLQEPSTQYALSLSLMMATYHDDDVVKNTRVKIQTYVDTHTNPPNSRHQWWWWWKCCCSKKKNIIFVFYNTQCSLVYLVWIVCTALCNDYWSVHRAMHCGYGGVSVQCILHCSVRCIAVAVGVIQWRGLDHIPGSGDIWAGNQSQGWGGKTFGGVVIRPGSRGGYIFGG